MERKTNNDWALANVNNNSIDNSQYKTISHEFNFKFLALKNNDLKNVTQESKNEDIPTNYRYDKVCMCMREKERDE